MGPGRRGQMVTAHGVKPSNFMYPRYDHLRCCVSMFAHWNQECDYKYLC